MFGRNKQVPVAHPALYALLKWLLFGSVTLFLVARCQTTRLPGPEHILPELLEAPLQKSIEAAPFSFQFQGLTYTVQPVAEYSLQGLLVSHNNVGGALDFDHPKIEVNTRDLCTVWGSSIESGAYLDSSFTSSAFACWWSSNTPLLKSDEVANNHLLTDREDLRLKLADARIGDQIRFKGYLVNYQDPHYGGQWRSSSLTRKDTMGFACEVVFFTDFEIIKPHARGWWRLRKILPWLILLTLIGLAILFAQPAHRTS